MTATVEPSRVAERTDRHQHLPVPILINNKPFKAEKTPMTVAELKQLASLPLDFNCYEVVQNKNVGPLANDHSVDLHPGQRFVIIRGEDPS